MRGRLTQCLVDQLIAIEFSDDTLIDPDFAIMICESTAAGLKLLSKEERVEFTVLLIELSKSYSNPDHKEFVVSLPEALGLDEET